MIKKTETVNLKKEIKKLKGNETIVALYPCDRGYFLFIGNDPVNHQWAVTESEMKELKKILNKHKEI